ncbi:hypothetical protein BDQ94DRAFT_79611 [Aspergillus welwitschiae]|uniref:Uncharacterized protein n=1 Tax=Aspergillus welwitschiae TaxID=1341132 RepID=A0A3F3PSF3_9EURO|nr:hypothetical protein BDQ94DRAFT_79611 [Aspergillus welwitschiae]RDH29870.1 hypothetical protein BDQ94DRAFT_79611 [Aspergillus welwitschiae]
MPDCTMSWPTPPPLMASWLLLRGHSGGRTLDPIMPNCIRASHRWSAAPSSSMPFRPSEWTPRERSSGRSGPGRVYQHPNCEHRSCAGFVAQVLHRVVPIVRSHPVSVGST